MASKTQRLNLRLTPAQDAVLRSAPQARGKSASEYALRHALESAEMDLADRRMFVIDDTAWNDLQVLLSAPASMPAPLVELLVNPTVTAPAPHCRPP